MKKEELTMKNEAFLNIVAKDLYARCEGRFDNVTIVFPNKRASLFFDEFLANMSDGPTWSPHYVTVSELFQSLSNLTPADNISLVCRLMKAYRCAADKLSTESGKEVRVEQSLDEFWSWGELMLSDFEDIDNNLVDAKELFSNISDLDDLTKVDYLSDEQMQTIRHFFPDWNNPTELSERFLTIWKLLLPTYKEFRAQLNAEHIAYESMLKRDVVDQLSRTGIDKISTKPNPIFAVVGFNVLTKAELNLLKWLRHNATTYFYWDYDEMYLPKNSLDAEHEAGVYIRENIALLGNALQGADCFNNLLKPKNINFISSPTEAAQAQYVGEKLAEANSVTDKGMTAIVLCNEALLMPLLHTLPASPVRANITMGFPMAETPISSLLSALINLQIRGAAGKGAWRLKYLKPVLLHPYINSASDGTSSTILHGLVRRGILYPQTEEFQAEEFLRTLLQPLTDTASILNWLLTIVREISRAVHDEPLGSESIFEAYTILSRLARLAEQSWLQVQPITLASILNQILRTKAVPFHGEPIADIQVMGLLETRNLDFHTVHLLSAGEGNLPRRTRHTPSFIPYFLRKNYGLNTRERQNSLYSYYFYRLLQRAHDVYIYWNNSTESTTRGEKSRYLMQMLIDPRFSNIHQYQLISPTRSVASSELEVRKTPDVLQALRSRFQNDPQAEHQQHQHILSPSAINTYITCPLKFYLSYVKRMRKETEIEDEVGNDTFGSIFHSVMERIYTDIIGLGREVDAQTLLGLSQNTQLIGRIVDECFQKHYFHQTTTPHYTGRQQLARQVVINYVRRQLHGDASLAPITVTHVEYPLLPQTVQLQDGQYITLGGTIDRIDIVTIDGHRQKRIADYKTGTSRHKLTDLPSLFNPNLETRNSHALQAFYYADLYTSQMASVDSQPIAPVLIYVAQNAEVDTKADIMTIKGADKTDTPITDFQHQCKAEYHQLLIEQINKIFSPETHFKQKRGQACQYCDFATLCH